MDGKHCFVFMIIIEMYEKNQNLANEGAWGTMGKGSSIQPLLHLFSWLIIYWL